MFASTPLYDIAIAGGGAAGTLLAIQLLRAARAPLRIAVLEPRAQLGRGGAHATRHAEHLLNVPAGGMSAFNDAPGDFVDWLLAGQVEATREALAARFVPRRAFADYLTQRLQEARDASTGVMVHLQTRATGIERIANGLRLELEDGTTLSATTLVLATGNAPRPLPARGASALPAAQRIEAWDTVAVDSIAADAQVCVIGSGLSMVDTAMALLTAGHRGTLHVLSRHGLMPLPHVEGQPPSYALDVDAFAALPLRGRMHALRAHAARAVAAGTPWQSVIDALRPHVQRLWTTLSCVDQRRFLRHVVRLWDVHRHRIAPAVHARLQQALTSGQLQRHRARLDSAIAGERCVQLQGHGPHGRTLSLEAACVVNATGVELRVQAMRNPLLSELTGRGLARPGPHGIGLDTDGDGRVLEADGVAQADLFALGSLRMGSLWESLAIPELRGQAEAIAKALLGAR
ncbi:FAD/NAD(P)-binding protein [Pseudoxanthomonas sp.]|uniref:FAD/NAD(P)-binding protein n=1 Tax=Pseudoxanthomonas sp. TaxID=1871049 RepID=UPI00261F28A5|nr:FAD/NAD(P)-binding protein [Pseudoxanthomonas sp.]WDS35064.1 MAG: FAD/NAD(P)-binding protein [Pseudoxanthomonas sp.]